MSFRSLLDKLHGVLQRRSPRAAPAQAWVTLDRSGQNTANPKVHVGFACRRPKLSGSMGVHTYPDNTQGNAHALMDARQLSEYLDIPISDRRYR